MGCYLLISLYKTHKRTPQRLYLVNLSITESLINLLEGVRTLIALLAPQGSTTALQVRHYLLIGKHFFGGGAFPNPTNGVLYDMP